MNYIFNAMGTFMVINLGTNAIILIATVCVVLVLFIAFYLSPYLSNIRFTVEYEALENTVDKAPVTQEDYDAIYDMFNETYCYTDEHVDRVLKLWKKYQAKFRIFVPELPGKG